MTLKSDAKFEEKLICRFKNDKSFVNLDPSLKNLHFDWSLSCKVYTFVLKRYKGAIFPDTEESCKI